MPLTVLDSSYRDLTGPVLEHIAHLRGSNPRDVVSVFIPEYVVGHWWEHLLHNQSALRLKTRLLFQPGVMVTNVPWQLGSAEAAEARRGSDADAAARHGRERTVDCATLAAMSSHPAAHAAAGTGPDVGTELPPPTGGISATRRWAALALAGRGLPS